MPEHFRPIQRILHVLRDLQTPKYTRPIETDLRYVINLAMQD